MTNKPITDAERFRAFAQSVVSVPKTEIDRREKAWKKKREAARKTAKA
jgi:hypothetical protein